MQPKNANWYFLDQQSDLWKKLDYVKIFDFKKVNRD